MYVQSMLNAFALFYSTYSANILLDKNRTAKVGDFGLAKKMPTVDNGHSYVRVTDYGGSLGYQAPEILEGEIGPKLDVYSLAVVSSLCACCY